MSSRLAALRHAKSAWPDGVPDLRRPLGDRGRRDAPVAGRWLRDNIAQIDLVVCSPAERTRQTWALVAEQLTTVPPVREEPRIYDGSLLDVVRDLPADAGTVLLIGHNPALEDLVELLAGKPAVFKTSTIALVDSDQGWADAGPGWGRLTSAVTPRG
jgi:phosphohistidine phosphatase